MDWWLAAFCGLLCVIQMGMLQSQRRTIDRLWKLYHDTTAHYTKRIKQLEDQNARDANRTEGPR